MDLLQVTRGNKHRYYLDGTRIGAQKAHDLKQECRQDSFSTEVDGDVVRNRSCLHPR